MRHRLLAVGLIALLAVAALALGPNVRADETSDRSWLVGWVENTISTPDRQIRLGRIDGALSSDVRLDAITIADRGGVWLTIRDVHLVWSRADLLRGKLSVASLEASAIEVARKPESAADSEAAASEPAADFALPDLPVAVDVGRISVPTVRLSADVAGRPTVLSIAGRGRLADGNLDVALSATRIEPQGGAFALKTTYGASDRRLVLDLSLAEPKGGFLSTLLALPGEPPIDFSIKGAAPIDAFAADIALAADGKPLLAGTAVTRLEGTDRTFAVDVAGSLEDLVGRGGRLTGGGSELHLFARRAADGAVRLDHARLKTGAAAFDASGAWTPRDGGSTLALDRLAVGWKTATLDLARPTVIAIADGRIDIPATTLRLGRSDRRAFGTIDVAGTAATDLALKVTARDLPVGVSALFVPDLGADGAVAVDLAVGGTRKAPRIDWRVTGRDLTLAATRTARLPAATLTASGLLEAKRTTLDARVGLGTGATLTARGTLPFAGTRAERDGLRLDVTAERLPLAFAAAVAPGIGGRGTLSGTAAVTGALDAPTVVWKLAGDRLGVAAVPGLAAGLAANGRLDPTGTTLAATLTDRDRLRLVAEGRVPFGDGALTLSIDGNAAAGLADAVSPGLGARGRVTLAATVAGTLAAPTATWKVTGSGLGVAGTPGLAATLGADGRLDRDGTTLTASLSDRDRLRLAADGRVPFGGGDLALKVIGNTSLALADAALRERGTRVGGRATLDVAVSGPLAAPRASGTVSVADGTVTDPETTLRLTAISALARLDGDRVTLERFQATTGKSGRIAARGTVGLGAGLPADLSVTLDAARLAVGDTLRSEIGGSLRLAGPLATAPTISGRLDLGRTEITIPERFAANAASLGVKDLAVPPEVRRTLALAKPKARKTGAKGTAAWRAGLDLTIDAPSRLFVRGRGIDAELGGTLHVTGTTDAVVPVGAFELRRGALDVIGRHIALDKGTVTLTGDLDPTIDFRATSSSRSISVVAEVTGRASDPALVLTSTPQLPQDEVLAQFLFGRGVADLTGFQLVQLASAAAQLAGGPSAPDLLGSIRKSTGLDTLGTTTDSKGNAGLTAGRYIGDRIFLGVTAGAAGSTDATVDLDVTRNLKLRGQTGTEGSKAGFVFEKEY